RVGQALDDGHGVEMRELRPADVLREKDRVDARFAKRRVDLVGEVAEAFAGLGLLLDQRQQLVEARMELGGRRVGEPIAARNGLIHLDIPPIFDARLLPVEDAYSIRVIRLLAWCVAVFSEY